MYRGCNERQEERDCANADFANRKLQIVVERCMAGMAQFWFASAPSENSETWLVH